MKIQNRPIPNRGTTSGRLIAMTTGAVCLVAQPVAADYASEVLSENPLAYYRFNDSVATDDLDTTVATNLGSLGSAGNGSFDGTNTRGVAGAISGDTAIAFAQAAPANINYVGSVVVPYDAALNPVHTGTNPFTVECWVKPNNNVSTLLSPLCSMTSAPGRAGYMIYQNAGVWQLRMGNSTSTTAALVLNAPANSVTAGAWQHLAFTYTGGANGTATLYVNGTNVASGVPSGTGYEANTSQPFRIGAFNALNRTFDGTVDEVAFFSGELSAARIAARYAEATANPSGYQAHVLADSPVGYWRLNEAPFVPRTPPVANNEGSLGDTADGAYYAGSKNTSSGPDSSTGFLGFGASNSALALHTANGHVGTALSLLDNRSAFTVSGWVKRGATKSTRGGYFGQNDLLEFGDADNGTNIEAWVNAYNTNLKNAFTFADDTWGFIVLTGDGTKSTLYLNGVQVTSVNGTVANYGASGPTNKFNIGGGGIFNTSGDYFRGEIDEVAVFDKALTAGRVKQLYDTALGNVPPTAAVPTVSPGTVIPEGQSYTLTVDPSGTPPFTYQWKRDGADISGATGKTYTVPSAAVQSPVTNPFEYTVTITNAAGSYTTDPALQVYVTPNLVWDGADATNPSYWDINTTPNWKPLAGGAPINYTDDFSVMFNDDATSTTVACQSDVIPQGTVFNNSVKTFTLTGDYGITGADGITKGGSGTVNLYNMNFYTGNTVVNAGTLRVGDGTTGSIAASSVVNVNGGTFDVNGTTGGAFTNTVAVGASGQFSISGTGDFNLNGSNAITGAGTELFNRSGGVVLVDRTNLVTNATIAAGEVAFTGSQNANRLAAGAAVGVSSGATMTIRGVNALPTGVNSANVTLNQGTLKVTASSGSHAHLNNIVLNGGAIVLDASAGGSYHGESFQLNGALSVTGSAPSAISYGTGGDAGNSGIALKAVKTFTVEDVTGDASADLTVTAELENPDSNDGALTKTGAGTLYLANGVSHSYSGATTVNQGTLRATGSVAGALSVAAAAALAPDGTFTAGETNLGGSLRCGISGATSDKLQVNGNLVLGAGAAINLSASSPTAPYYQIVGYTGTLSGNTTPTVTGMPAGYNLVIAFNSIMIAQAGLSFTPVISNIPGSGSTQLSAGNFDADNGSFTVSAPVTAETDWTYSAGSWRSNGQNSAFGSDNVSYLTSPPFTLTKSGVFTLTFSHRHSFEFYEPADAYDAGVVEVSINNGPFRKIPLSAFTQNGYNGTVMAGTSISLAGQQAFISNSAGHPAFITSVCKAGVGNVGDVVQVRFMSASDNNTSGSLTPQGWEIDSYEFAEGAPGGASIAWPIGVLQYSDNLQPPWTDLPDAASPWFIDTTLAPRRFFRIKP